MRCRKTLLLTGLMLTAALSVTIASAYYTSMASESAVGIKAARLCFSDGTEGDAKGDSGKDEGSEGDSDTDGSSQDKGNASGSSIKADTSGFDDRLTPLKEGDSFDISFSAIYEGEVEAYAAARLGVSVEGFSEGDIVRISDGVSEIYLSEKSGELYSLPELLKPGDELKKTYHITVVKKNSDEPLIFKYDFGLAAVQKKGNEELYKEYENDGKGFYEEIEKGNASGFSELTGPDDVKEDGEKVIEKKYYSLMLTPVITVGNTSVNVYTWQLADGEDLGNSEALKLVLNNKNIGEGLKVCLKAENEAGYVSSDIYRITLEQEIVSVRREVT